MRLISASDCLRPADLRFFARFQPIWPQACASHRPPAVATTLPTRVDADRQLSTGTKIIFYRAPAHLLSAAMFRPVPLAFVDSSGLVKPQCTLP